MIEPGDYVHTIDGYHGKVRTICNDSFIVILLDNNQCHVCKRSMIIGEREEVEEWPEDINFDIFRQETLPGLPEEELMILEPYIDKQKSNGNFCSSADEHLRYKKTSQYDLEGQVSLWD